MHRTIGVKGKNQRCGWKERDQGGTAHRSVPCATHTVVPRRRAPLYMSIDVGGAPDSFLLSIADSLLFWSLLSRPRKPSSPLSHYPSSFSSSSTAAAPRFEDSSCDSSSMPTGRNNCLPQSALLPICHRRLSSDSISMNDDEIS